MSNIYIEVKCYVNAEIENCIRNAVKLSKSLNVCVKLYHNSREIDISPDTVEDNIIKWYRNLTWEEYEKEN
jgi:hypothetical protein